MARFQPGFIGKRQPPTTLTLVGTGFGFGGFVPLSGEGSPAGVAVGDLAVLWSYGAKSGATPTVSPPEGWTQISSTLNSNDVGLAAGVGAAGIAAYRVLTSTNVASVSNNYDWGATALAVFRPDKPIGMVTVHDAFGQFTHITPSNYHMDEPGLPPLVALGLYGSYVFSGGAIATRTFTPAKDGEQQAANSDVTDAYLAWRIINGETFDVTIGMPDSGSHNALLGCYLSVS